MGNIGHWSLTFLGLLIGGSATAANFTLNLSAAPPSVAFRDFQSDPGFVTDYYFVRLNGLDNSDAITVTQGDTITENIAFSAPFATAAAADVPETEIVFNGLDANDYSTLPRQSYQNTSVVTLYSGGQLIATALGGGNGSSHVANYLDLPPSTSFDSLTNVITLEGAVSPVTLNETSYNEFVTYAVPEPSAWMLMLTGLGAVGLSLRRKTGRPSRV